MLGKVNFWIAWNGFGDNSCNTIASKISGKGYPEYSEAAHVRDGGYYFGNTYVGEFNLPVFIVIDANNKYVTCMASQDHDGGANALNIAKSAVQALLSQTSAEPPRARTAVSAHPVTLVQTGNAVVFTNSSRAAATIRLADMQGRVVACRTLSAHASLTVEHLQPASYAAAVTVDGKSFCRYCTVTR